MKNNNHHTVPKGYLKYFAVFEEHTSKKPKRICSFSKEHINCEATIDAECSNGKYYSDALELEMARGIENKYPDIIQKLINVNFERSHLMRERVTIDAFVVLQAMRTPEAKRSANSALDVFRENLNAVVPVLPWYLRLCDVFTKGWVSMQYNEEARKMVKDFTPDELVKKYAHNISDLEIEILYNATKRPFITSDHPVICWNPFLNERIKHELLYKENLNCRGLIILLPVNSKCCMLYYDSIVYKIRKFLYLQRSEVDAINRLQYANSGDRIYFSPEFEREPFKKHLLSLSKNLFEVKKAYNERVEQGKSSVSTDYISFGRVEKLSSFCKIPNFLQYTDDADKIDLNIGRNWFR